MTFEQSFGRTEEVSQAEGTAGVKTPRRECAWCYLRKNKEAKVAGQSQPGGKQIIQDHVKSL